MKNFGNIMKQAQQMQERLLNAQSKISEMEIEGSSGGDMVKIRMSGAKKILSIEIDDSLLNPTEKDVLSDLIIAAFDDACRKLEKKTEEEMSIFGDLFPAGMKLPF